MAENRHKLLVALLRESRAHAERAAEQMGGELTQAMLDDIQAGYLLDHPEWVRYAPPSVDVALGGLRIVGGSSGIDVTRMELSGVDFLAMGVTGYQLRQDKAGAPWEFIVQFRGRIA